MAKRKTKFDKQMYLEERKMFFSLLQTSANTLDKHMFLLASGSILLSTTFLEKIVNNTNVLYPDIIIASWGFLVSGLISVLLSFYTSGKACHRSIEIIDNSYDGIPDESINIWAKATDILNIISIITIIIGVVLLAVFSFKNIINRG
jgi:hypothetical protein